MEIVNQNNGRKNRRAHAFDVSTMVYGKLPPQARDLEEAILGACLLQRDAFDTVIEILRPECFYVDAHQRIFRCFMEMSQKSIAIDMMLVIEQLNKREELDTVGGPFAITKLTNSVVSTANLDYHCRIVLDKFNLREIIRVSGETIGEAYDPRVDTQILMDSFADRANKIGESKGKDFSDMTANMVKFHNELDEKALNTADITGIPSGITSLDKITYGWQKTDLITIAARPGAGKTMIGINFGVNAARRGYPVALFLLEVPAQQAIQRIVSAETGISYWRIRHGKLDAQQREMVNLKTIEIECLPIYIDDTIQTNHIQIRSKLKRIMRQRVKERTGNGLDPNENWLAIVDYVQIMKMPPNVQIEKKDQQVGENTFGLKKIAKDLNIPVIDLAQLTRDADNRKGMEPQLRDLADSASLEKDSDIVMFLYQPDEHKKSEVMLKIAKHRNGEHLKTMLHGDFAIQKFSEPVQVKKEQPSLSIPFIQKGTKMGNEEFDEGVNNFGDKNNEF